jgi:hypothetical protein
MKILRRSSAIIALVAIAIKGALSFLSWAEKQDAHDSIWAEEEELEEAF